MADAMESSRGQRGPLPIVAVPMGDPAGIGPEIVVKALMGPECYEAAVPVVIGDAGVLADVANRYSLDARIVKVDRVEDAKPEQGVLAVLDMANVPESVKMGVVSIEGGRASIEYLTRAVELALAGRVESVASAPLNKAAMKKAGFDFSDEYEYQSHLCGEMEYVMMTVSPTFSLGTVVLHVPMKDMPAMITKERVLKTIRYSDGAARAAGVEHPRIGVAALNPHAGEEGLVGTEEITAIRPAVEAAIAEGIDAHGPFPADTFFLGVKSHAYDVYVGMYHDQGRIPIKLLDFGLAVTMAEGFPYPFCTTGHGTGFDIAGKGIAKPENIREAIIMAGRRAMSRRAEAAKK